jgi:epoxyqueuosine reductase QueG
MLNRIKELLAAHGITLAAPLSLADCTVQKPYLLERAGIASGTAILFAVPYYTTDCDSDASNISAYAVSRDYHLFFKELFERILPILQSEFPENRFAGFTDHSPILEAQAAVRAGLGYWGCNHLFLTSAHSSFVFLGEIVTDARFAAPRHEETSCAACGACRAACPVGLDVSRCHSALTQKKGALSPEEIAALRAHGSAWGCDLCQLACPVTKKARENGTLYTAIPFFTESAHTPLTAKEIEEMPDEEFTARAYSWRGKPTVLRNLKYLEEENA